MTAPASDMLRVTEHPLDADAETAAFRKNHRGAGAIVTFLGQVRPQQNSAGVKLLRLEHYPEFTERKLNDFISHALTRWPLTGLRIVHRIGDIKPEEPIVFVAAASNHRREAFEAVDYLMDYLKSEAPFWKQEVTDRGAEWIEPRQADYVDKARWDKVGEEG